MRARYTLACMGIAAWGTLAVPQLASAHCDAINGPVVVAARQALEKGDITPVLRWIKADGEAEVRAAFDRTVAVRKLGPEAKELADRFFFETAVRIHRLGEGAGFTGLKPADYDPGRAVTAVDQAVEAGSVDEVVHLVTEAVSKGIRERFRQTITLKREADHSVSDGRRYVAAYVEFVHYVKRLYDAATSSATDAHGEAEAAGSHASHGSAHAGSGCTHAQQ